MQIKKIKRKENSRGSKEEGNIIKKSEKFGKKIREERWRRGYG